MSPLSPLAKDTDFDDFQQGLRDHAFPPLAKFTDLDGGLKGSNTGSIKDPPGLIFRPRHGN